MGDTENEPEDPNVEETGTEADESKDDHTERDSAEEDVRDWGLPDIAQLRDVDLSELLTRLHRFTAEGRKKAANDPATRSYLQAGLRLLSAAVSAPARTVAEGDDPACHPFMAWMSRRRILEEVQNETDEDLRGTASGTGLRDRWAPHRNFIADLLTVAVAADGWERSVSHGAMAHLTHILDLQPSQVAHEIAFQDLVQLADSDSFRVQILAASMARNDPDLGSCFEALYKHISDSWTPIYELVLTRWHRRLRPGFTMEMLATLLASIAEGLGLRLVETANTAPILDHATQRSLLGQGALAVIMGVTVDAGSDDDRTLEELADQTLGHQGPDGD